MAEYIEREAALMKLMQDGCSAKNLQSISDMPGANAVSLHDIYRVIAGHSYYHGDRILAALTCIVEGKEVNPVCPADVAPVVHGQWIHSRYEDCSEQFEIVKCSQCNHEAYAMALYVHGGNYCPNCGAKMDGGTDHEAD